MIELNRSQAYGCPLEAQDYESLGQSAAEQVRQLLSLCPRHRPTPLLCLPELASSLKIGGLHIKDESDRLGLGSFKAMGGAYAVIRLFLEKAEASEGAPVSPDRLRDPALKKVAAGMTVACATDGNHGRSVAAGARLVGCRAVIFVHAGVDRERVAAIARFGAEILTVPGSYDDAVAEAEHVCRSRNWTIVSDTSWPGYERVARLVMQGYTVIAEEALAETQNPPTHVFLQAGVGGFAAAVAASLKFRLGRACPKIVIVEPERAACLFESNRAGKLVKISQGEPTLMAMLECYEPSLVAWRLLSRIADVFMTVADADAIESMRRLGRPLGSDPVIVSGESGAAGLAGLLNAARSSRDRETLALDAASRVLLFNTEGDTAPTTYRKLMEIAD